ncbi:MAG: hypothetical protein DRR16_19800 [Candidatus Parabeggiatoa sp. nov. 3]|nr:MAG: hypothetical protein DRR16_19800 [Gammaproteobacteria bacterium]
MNDPEQLYRKKVAETYNKLVLTGLPERDPRLNNIALEHIFVKLTIAVESATAFQSVLDFATIRAEVEADEDSERLQRRRFEREQIAPPKPIDIATALQQYRRLIMTGAPGSGKTTLLRWLAVTFARRQQADESRLGAAFTENTLPILLELRRFAQRFQRLAENPAPFDLAQEISAYIGADPRFSGVSEAWMREALAQQPCLLLLDGLDEIADRSTRQRLLEALEAFIQIPTYAHVRCILTTRPHGFQEVNIGTAFQRTEVRPFTSDDVAQFIQHWYATAYDPEYQTEAQELIAAIQAQERVTALAQNPLLCTIIAIIYRNNRVLPNRRVELYLKCCEALLDTWERNKNIKDSGLIGGFDWQTKLELLMPVAYWFHQHSEQLAMPEEAVVQQLAQALEELRKNSGLDSANKPLLQEAREFIVAIRDRSGLLQGRGDGTLEFSHRTFQEYLAARYIAAQPDPVYIDIVMAHLHEAWWQEVHLLVIGHLGSGRDNAEKATRLMLTILNVYKAPNRWLLYPRVWWLRWFNPDKDWQDSIAEFLLKWLLRFNLGTRLPRFQWQKRIAWHLMREFELVAQGYADCAIGARTKKLSSTLSDFSVKRISQWLYNPLYREQQDFLLKTVAQQNLPRDAVVDIVLKALPNKIAWVRRAAAESLGQLGQGNDSVIAALLKALQDKKESVRRAAAKSLGQLGQGNDSVIAALLKALQDEDDWQRRTAAESLGQLGQGNDSVIAALLKAWQNENFLVRHAATKSLGQLGQGNDSVISALLNALQDDDKDVRRAAASSLGQLGEGNDSVIAALLKALQDDDKDVRRAAASSLGQLGQGNDSVIAALLKALQDDDKWVRCTAAESLGQLGQGNDSVIAALLKALQDDDDWVRRTAVSSLGQLGQGNDSVIAALLKALHEDAQ